MAQVWHRGRTAAHQATMGDDPPDLGEAERGQSSVCDRGAPVAVGLVVAHHGIDEAGPTLHHLGEHLQRSRWPTGTGPEVAHTSVPAGRNPSGRHYKEHEAYLYKSAEKNVPESTPEDERRGDRGTHPSARTICTWVSPLVSKSNKVF